MDARAQLRQKAQLAELCGRWSGTFLHLARAEKSQRRYIFSFPQKYLRYLFFLRGIRAHAVTKRILTSTFLSTRRHAAHHESAHRVRRRRLRRKNVPSISFCAFAGALGESFFLFSFKNLKNESIFSLCHVAYYYLTTDLLTYSRKNATFSPLRQKMKRREEDNSG